VLVMSDIPSLGDYPHVADVTTRWNDNDVYGHVNNVICYSYFGSVANAFLIEEGGLDIHGSDVIGLVVESGCRYHAPIEYPATLRIGLRVDRLGDRSGTYGLGVFTARPDAGAHGYFSHVFVDRRTRQPTAIPANLRTALEQLVVA
jgi:acyl-CoA thioester hydrolase